MLFAMITIHIEQPYFKSMCHSQDIHGIKIISKQTLFTAMHIVIVHKLTRIQKDSCTSF